jgi:hypothetical protein
MAPEEVFRFNPAGREPEATLYVKGDVPPVGVGTEALYAVPTAPPGNVAVGKLRAVVIRMLRG